MENIIRIESKFLKNIFEQNTYVLNNENESVIIDAGAELEDIIEAVENRKVLAVLITHLHFDHIWNIEKIVKYFDCDVYICQNQEFKLLDPKFNASVMIRSEIIFNVNQNKIKYYAEKIQLGEFEFKLFNSAGHTADSVCILWKDNLFVGDTLFIDGVGRTDLIDSDAFELAKSLRQIKIIDFKTAYPGHYQSFSKEQAIKIINMFV